MSSLRSSFLLTFWTPFFSAKINQEIMTCANPITLPTQGAGTTGRREIRICVSLCLHRGVCRVKAWDENLSFILYFYNSQIKLFEVISLALSFLSIFLTVSPRRHVANSTAYVRASNPVHFSLHAVSLGFILTCKLSAVDFLLGDWLLVAFLGFIHIILLCCLSIKVISANKITWPVCVFS